MHVARFQCKNGLVIKEISEDFANKLKLRKPNGKPVQHPYGECLVVWYVPNEWEREAVWRAKMGYLNPNCIWEYNGVGITQ